MTPALISHGIRVVGMDCGFYETSDFFGSLATVEEFAKDIRLAKAEDFKGIDAVIHLAALSNDPTGDLDPGATDSINRAGTEHLARLAKSQGVKRFLFLSSCSLYGAAGDQLIDELAPVIPLTAYGQSKIDSERALLALNDKDFSVTCLRGGTAYGASPRLRLDLLVNDLVSTAICDNRIELLSDGLAWRPLVHIRDFVNAAISILRAPLPAVFGEAFNIGRTDQNFQVLEVARAVQRQIPSAGLVFGQEPGHDARTYRVSCEKAHRRIPGLAIGWTIDQGIIDLENICRQRLTVTDAWHRQDFSRVARLKELITIGTIDLDDPERITRYARNCLKTA